MPAIRVVGVRPPPTSPRWGDGQLQFAAAGDEALEPGEWVLIDAPDGPWVGEVVVTADQVVEAPPIGPLPCVLRPADEGERPPARTEGAGLDLLRSLGLPAWATRPRSAPAEPPGSARPAPPAEQE